MPKFPSEEDVMAAMRAMPPPQSDEDAIAGTCDVALNNSDCCGDGDQRQNLVSCGHGEQLYQLWCRGGNLNPWSSPHQYSAFFVACAWGQLNEVEATIRASADRKELLERRESNLRYAPLHVAIAGSRIEPGTPTWPRVSTTPAHAAVVRALLTAGARVNAKDIMGNTAMNIAAGAFATARSLDIARTLATFGADLCTRTRFRHPLLLAPCTSIRPNLEAISLLLELGADPTASMGSFRSTAASMGNTLCGYLQQRESRQALELCEPLSHAGLPIGTEVEIKGLESRADLNGSRGTVRGWFSKVGRYQVELDSETSSESGTSTEAAGTRSSIKVKPVNLQRAASAPSSAPTRRFAKGWLVKLHSLERAADLNGRIGVVEKWDEEAERYHVHIRPPSGIVAQVPAACVCLLPPCMRMCY
jgi:hypothetical protein